ncbi:hypothetical protein SISSUDRAFT_1049896, partial [Sistotremastrum suecicum HHB10207 ss-3]
MKQQKKRNNTPVLLSVLRTLSKLPLKNSHIPLFTSTLDTSRIWAGLRDLSNVFDDVLKNRIGRRKEERSRPVISSGRKWRDRMRSIVKIHSWLRCHISDRGASLGDPSRLDKIQVQVFKQETGRYPLHRYRRGSGGKGAQKSGGFLGVERTLVQLRVRGELIDRKEEGGLKDGD